MTPSEMIYVLDKIRECVYKRGKKNCDLDCEKCDFGMNTNNTLEALDRITNLITNIDNRSTRRNF